MNVARLEEQLAAARAAAEEARRALVAALADEAVAAWWRDRAGQRQMTDTLGSAWLVRTSTLTRAGTLEELLLVRPVAHVRLAGEADPVHPRRRLAHHLVTVLEETRRTAVPAERPASATAPTPAALAGGRPAARPPALPTPPRPRLGDVRQPERLRLAAGDRD